MVTTVTTAWVCAAIAGGAATRPTPDAEHRETWLGAAWTSHLDGKGLPVRLQQRYRQKPGQPIVMEAERATSLRLFPDKGVVRTDAKAGGGLYVVHVDAMTFQFEVVDPGRYTAWYRATFPWKGSWSHHEAMDRGKVHRVVDSRGEVLNRWIWTRGPTYHLSAGRHEWRFPERSAWCGGTGLDRVVLVRDPASKPTGMGPTALRSIGRTTGVLGTETLRRNVVGWERLIIDNPTGRGKVDALVSADGGKHWRKLAPDRSLAHLPVDRPLQFLVHVHAGPDGSTPYVTSVRVAYRARKQPQVVLANQRVELVFAPGNAALVALRNKTTGASYLAPGTEVPLFAMRALKGNDGHLRDIGAAQARLVKVARPTPNGQLTLDYALMDGKLQVRLRVRLQPEGVVRWSTTVTNRSEWRVAETVLVGLRGVRIGPDPTDDRFCIPNLSGRIVRNPAAEKDVRSAYTDRAMAYPGHTSMCWVDLWDPKGGGLYVAYEDPHYYYTAMELRPDPDGKSMRIGFRKQRRIDRTTGPVQLPDLVFGVHQGDWHWGADAYRDWFWSVFPKPRVPDWFADLDGWVMGHAIHVGAFVDLTKGGPSGAKVVHYDDPPVPMLATWCQHASCEAYWSIPCLHRLLGTDEQFKHAIQVHHEMGHRLTFYLLPSKANPIYNRAGKRFGCVPRRMVPDRELPTEGFYGRVGIRTYAGALQNPDGMYSEANCCYGVPEWREHMRFWAVDKYVAEYGTDGMYLDGLGLSALRCDTLEHGHDYGQWHQGMVRMLQTIREQARRRNPGAVFVGESMAGVLGGCLDAGLTDAGTHPDVYRYTFPEHHRTMLFSINKAVRGFTADDWLEYGIVYGFKIAQKEADYASYLKQLRFRRQFSQFQFRSRFLGDLGLGVSDPDVCAKLYVRDEARTSGALVVAFNPKGKKDVTAEVDLERFGPPRTAWTLPLGSAWRPAGGRVVDRRYRFTVPPERLSATMILNRCEPMLQVSCDPIVPGETGTATVIVRNLGADPLKGRVALGTPPRWKSDRVPLELASGHERRVELKLHVPRKARLGVHDLYGVAARIRRCVPVGVCRPIRAEMDYTDVDALELRYNNASTQPVKGTVRLVTPEPVTATPTTQPFAVGPRAQGKVRFRLKHVDRVTVRKPIKAVLTYGQYESSAHELVQPPIINGGFEVDTAGDGKPDYWNYRNPQTRYADSVLDSKVVAQGQHSVRLDPVDRGTNGISTTFLRLLPSRKYRFSIMMRRSTDARIGGGAIFSLASVPRPPKRGIVHLGPKKPGQPGQWVRYEGVLTTLDHPLVRTYQVYLGGANDGKTVVWFDDVRVELIK